MNPSPLPTDYERILEQIRSACVRLLPKGLDRVVEIGCGPGDVLLKAVQLKPGMLVGLDRSQPSAAASAILIQSDLTRLPLKDETFDAVLCVNVAVCLTRQELERGIVEMVRITRRGGRIVLQIQNLWSPLLGLRTWGRRLLHGSPLAFPPDQVLRMFWRCGVRTAHFQPVYLDPFYGPSLPLWGALYRQFSMSYHALIRKYARMAPVGIICVEL